MEVYLKREGCFFSLQDLFFLAPRCTTLLQATLYLDSVES